MSVTAPILATKLYISSSPPELVSRPSSNKRLNNGLLKKILDLGLPLLSVNCIDLDWEDSSKEN
jgi:hypothetical protein